MELAIDRLLQSKYNVRDDVIKKAFYFCPIKKRMGVIVEINAMYFYFTKGAPDVLLNLSYKDKW